MSGQAGPTRARLDSLTGLRFFAALAVLGFHFDLLFFTRSGALRSLPPLLVQGPVGVSFFFILSGFVLTWSHRPGDGARSFLRRRLARIGPLQIATWALMAVIVVILRQWPGWGRAGVSLALLDPWTPGWSARLVINVPSWSLGCELFFYLLFPLLFAGLVRLRPRARRAVGLAGLGAIEVLAAALGPGTSATARWLLYFFPPTRLLEFVVGMVLALEVAGGTLPRIPLLAASALAVAGYVGAGEVSAAFAPVATTVVPFALLIAAAAQADSLGRPSAFRAGPLVSLGVWSFALYLGHLAVLEVMTDNLRRAMGPGLTLLVGLGFLAGSVGLAGLLHVAVERPLEARLRRAPPRPEADQPPWRQELRSSRTESGTSRSPRPTPTWRSGL